jgi:predicted negative regulator of RcsB-dependent stress response
LQCNWFFLKNRIIIGLLCAFGWQYYQKHQGNSPKAEDNEWSGPMTTNSTSSKTKSAENTGHSDQFPLK